MGKKKHTAESETLAINKTVLFIQFTINKKELDMNVKKIWVLSWANIIPITVYARKLVILGDIK